MSNSVRSIRGMSDVLPEQTTAWQFLEQTAATVLASYGYQEIRMPIVEHTELFKRSIGEVTDIVEKEMYTFEDRNGDSLTLRPEGTASCVRACIQNGLLHNQTQRIWYMGPMFRHERPQKGRYRQFHQIGVETFGMRGPDIDAELILLSARLWKALGLLENVRLELNSLGSVAVREKYRGVLVEYLGKYEKGLDADSVRRLQTNPLRILDSKNPEMEEIISGAPRLLEYLDKESEDHFRSLRNYLEQAGVDYVINERLVRGLDYYCDTVFEWVTDGLGAQGTVCAGGRYDGLVEQLGGKPTPAAGFAMGIERLVELRSQLATNQSSDSGADIYIVVSGLAAQQQGMLLAEQLRDHLPAYRVQLHCGQASFKSQFKRADRSGAKLALILGDDELKNEQVGAKWLRGSQDQQLWARDDVVSRVSDLMSAE